MTKNKRAGEVRFASVKGILNDTLVLPSSMCSSFGAEGMKSVPAFAVPDSVHQVKPISPCELILRLTTTRADDSAEGTSTVAAAISIRAGGPADFEGIVTGTAEGGAAAADIAMVVIAAAGEGASAGASAGTAGISGIFCGAGVRS